MLLGRDEDQVVLPDQLGRGLVAKDPNHRLVGEPDDAVVVDVHALDRPIHDRAIPLLAHPEGPEGGLRVGARRLLAAKSRAFAMAMAAWSARRTKIASWWSPNGRGDRFCAYRSPSMRSPIRIGTATAATVASSGAHCRYSLVTRGSSA